MLTQIPDPTLQNAPSPGQTRRGRPKSAGRRGFRRLRGAVGCHPTQSDSECPRSCPCGGGAQPSQTNERAAPRDWSPSGSLQCTTQPAPRIPAAAETRAPQRSTGLRAAPRKSGIAETSRHGSPSRTGLKAARETHDTHCPRCGRHSGLSQ